MSDNLYVVLIQIVDDTLMLPNAAVSEVAALDRFEPAGETAPPWLVGWYATAERRVPVISFEALRGAPRPAPNRRARVVLCNPVGVRLHGGTFALLAQGHPNLITLNRNAIAAIPPRANERTDLVLSRVRVASQEAAIPDLEAIEAKVASNSAAG